MTELCERYGVSRKTGYKWLARYQSAQGVAELSRRPHHCPTAVPPDIEARLIRFRQAHPLWGPKKLRAELQKLDPTTPWPACSTISRVLKRRGLVRMRRRRHRPGHPGRPLTTMDQPNAVWSIDFKGQFRAGLGAWCYPLTIVDGYSRFLLACDALRQPSTAAARAVLERVFRRYGLPTVVRSDNGAPFAGTGLSRLSRLSVWWMRLGIRPELIELASPQQNGRHERLHKTLKAETARPPAATWAAQVRRFQRFRARYNFARPHEALQQQYPGTVFHPSSRPYPTTLPAPEYPATWTPRRVYDSGEIEWRGHRIWLSEVLARETIALHEVADGVWNLHLGAFAIGYLDERRRRAMAAPLWPTREGGARVHTHARADCQPNRK